ncbi:multidrug efflux RND transporter permease subunit [Phragmitibacter flavus]|uniref:Multidrug efflux RND transporter permease subunit n=1 Tax=Phragmitibacter flavus TaxID=2576071 RepID=A0A5R8KGL6_9BACT|nr:multidrug efflux RND transporter permease subunit [Phragmitibacter flavus]TLD71105.1 multidrug efflux RND transporter permease subunit [Phragmitibacter flavus]
MNIPKFFVDRPVFAAVLSIVITLLGGLAYFTLPVSQYPDVIPPTVVVSATYPGANATVLADTVATPLEQEINGVEDMLYLSSSSTSDGRLNITVTFKLGTDLDKAQVLVQNRVNAALPRLPEDVRRMGVQALKRSPDLTMAIQFYSPDDTRDVLYLANYVNIQVQNRLARLPGVAEASSLGGLDFTMRVWLDPEKLAVRNLTATDVVSAIREQNIQVAAGQLGQPPAPSGIQFQYTLTTQGRLRSAEEFNRIVLRTGESGDVIRLKDVARVELGGKDYAQKSYRDGKNAVSMRIFQLPGTNALETSDVVRAEMLRIKERFPPGVDYSINYDPTQFIRDSMTAVMVTLLEAILLVVIVVVVFLQSWRASVIPLLAIPVSLIGTLAVMAGFGFSLNNLSLFGIVLAIGIVVDDAIVVVENVERYLEKGFAPREATIRAMQEVTGPVIAIGLVLSAVFVPTAFLTGITGEFYRQFALTIAASTLLSVINSLTLSPALAALLLRPHSAPPDRFSRIINFFLGWFFKLFNKAFSRMSDTYARIIGKFIRHAFIGIFLYGGLIALAFYAFKKVPTGFIPQQDMGYFMTVIQLPDGASFERTDEIVRRVDDLARSTPGIAHTFAISGYSNVLQANQSNLGACFMIPAPFADRKDPSLHANALMATLRKKFADIKEARVLVLPPPPLRGLGNAGGFKLQVEDLNNAGLPALEAATQTFIDALAKEPGFNSIITGFRANTPQYNLVIDRERAKTMDVSISSINETLSTFLGSTYVNDFNLFGRTWQVMAMAEPNYRMKPEDVGRLRTRNNEGEMVPLGALVKTEKIGGADRVQRYNMFVSADVSGNTDITVSSGEMIDRVDQVAKAALPDGFDYEWTDVTYQQILAGDSIIFIFPLCVLFVFLVLSAQYESWSLPFAVILIVPMCLLSAIGGVWLTGKDNNIFTQIGLVVLVGLAAKNAILIVEFARQQQDQYGKNRFDAAVEACRLRLRPILMTSFAFILGVLPLVLASGAGAEMRNALGTAVFYGMLGVTFFGLLFTPVFYVIIAKFMKARKPIEEDASVPATPGNPALPTSHA